jgi:HK97 family phage major capsid protein
MTDLAEIKGLVEKINPTLTELRSEVDAMKADQPKDYITEEKHQKMADEVTKKMQEIMDAQVKMQTAMTRPAAGESDPEAKKQFNEFMRKSGLQQELEVRAMSTDIAADGGILVRPEFSDTVVSRVFETSAIRQVANIEQTGGKSRSFLIDDDEAAARWAGEGAAGGETGTPSVGLKEIAVHKLEALPKITQEELDDAYIDVETWLANKVSDKFSRTENTAFVSGDGVGKPRGFLTYAAGTADYARNTIEQMNSGTAANVNADGLISLQASLKEMYQPGAVFGMKRATYGECLKLKGADSYFFGPLLIKDGQAQMQLLGRPVLFMDDMPAVGANALSVVYGDFGRGYTILDRVGIIILRDPFTAKGFVTFYTTKRNGGDVTNFEALKIMKCAA